MREAGERVMSRTTMKDGARTHHLFTKKKSRQKRARAEVIKLELRDKTQ